MVNIIFDTFNNIENFTSNMIPVSISNQPPDWFIETNDDSIDYYINNNGVICGLKYEPLRLEVNYQEKLTKVDSARFITLCANTINLLKERLKFKKDGVIVLMHNKDEDISLLKEYLIENKIMES
ncbi:MAG: hypothetical protein SO206_02730 [Bacilli bacterium]|nr:hypothetical protein [Bacilli bacterium]